MLLLAVTGLGVIVPALVAAFFRGRQRGTALTAAGILAQSVVIGFTVFRTWFFLSRPGTVDTWTFGSGGPFDFVLTAGPRESVLMAVSHILGLLVLVTHNVGAASPGRSHLAFAAGLFGADGLVMCANALYAPVFFAPIIAGFGLLASADAQLQWRRRLVVGSVAAALVPAGALIQVSVPAIGSTLTAAGFVCFLFRKSLSAFPEHEHRHHAAVGIASLAANIAAIAGISRTMAGVPGAAVTALLWLSLLTYAGSGVYGFKGSPDRRRLSRFETANTALIVAVLCLVQTQRLSAYYVTVVVGGLLLSLMLAYGPLVIVTQPGRRQSLALSGTLFFLAVAATAFPPFPGFWARWQLLNTLIAADKLILLSLFALGWLLNTAALLSPTIDRAPGAPSVPARRSGDAGARTAVGSVGVVVLAVLGVLLGWVLGMNDRLMLIPPVLAAGVLIGGWWRWWLSALLAAAGIVLYMILVFPVVSGLALVLTVLVSAGAVVATIWLAGTRNVTSDFAAVVLATTGMSALMVAPEPITIVLAAEFVVLGLVVGNRNTGRTNWALLCAGVLFAVGVAVAMQEAVIASGAGLPEVFGADGYVRLPALTGGWPPGRVMQTESAGAAARVFGLPVSAPGEWAQSFRTGTRGVVAALMGSAAALIAGAFVVHPWKRRSYLSQPHMSLFLTGPADLVVPVIGLVMVLMVGPLGASTAVIRWAGLITAVTLSGRAVIQNRMNQILASGAVAMLGLVMFAMTSGSHAMWVAGLEIAILRSLSLGGMFAASRCLERPLNLSVRLRVTALAVILVAVVSLSGLPPGGGFAAMSLMVSSLIHDGAWPQLSALGVAVVLTWVYLFKIVRLVGQKWSTSLQSGESTGQGRPTRLSKILYMGALTATVLPLAAVSLVPNLIRTPISMSVATWFTADSTGLIEPWSGIWWYALYAACAGLIAWYVLSRQPKGMESGSEVRTGSRVVTSIESSALLTRLWAEVEKLLPLLGEWGTRLPARMATTIAAIVIVIALLILPAVLG